MTRVVMLVGKATGGIGVHVRDLAAGLAAAGTEVAIVTDPLTARTFGLGGARLLWPDPRRPDPRRLGELRRLLRGADVVHAHGHQAGLVAAFALGPRPRRARSRPAFVISLHNEVPLLRRPLRPVIERAERTAMRRADLVTGASADLVAAARGLRNWRRCPRRAWRHSWRPARRSGPRRGSESRKPTAWPWLTR